MEKNNAVAEAMQQEINSLGYEAFQMIRNIEYFNSEIQKLQQEVSKKSADIATKEKELKDLT